MSSPSTAVLIVVVRGVDTSPLDGWGSAPTVLAVIAALTGSGIRATALTVRFLEELAILRDHAGVVVIPTTRYFRDYHGRQHMILDYLHAWGIPFLGVGTQADAVATSKTSMKAVLTHAGIPTPRQAVVTDDSPHEACARLRYPLMVKSDHGSMSLAMSRVDQPSELASAVRRIRETTESGTGGQRLSTVPILVEEWLRHREYTVAVVGNGTAARGFPIEVVPPPGYDYMDADLKMRAIHESRLVDDPATAARVSAIAVSVYAILGIPDRARIDVLEDVAGALYVIDVNTFPALGTPEKPASFPLCLRHNRGLDYATSVLAMVAPCLLRHGFPLPGPVRAAYDQLADDHPDATVTG